MKTVRCPYPGREREGQLLAQSCEHRAPSVREPAAVHIRSAGRDVGEHEGLDEAAASRRAAMGYEVRLNEAWRWIVPIRRRSNGKAPSQGVRCGSSSGRPKPARIGPSALSIVAALIASNLPRISGARSK